MTSLHATSRRLMLAGILMATVAAALVFGLLSRDASATPTRPAGDPDKTQVARALAQAPAAGDNPLTGAAVFAERDTQVRNIPLPTGGNFNGVNFNATFTPAQIARELQANAACQWWRVAANGDNSAVPEARAIPNWPAFRGGAENPLRPMLDAANANLDDPDALRKAIPACAALHDTLVRQAADMGQIPPQ